MPRPQRCRLIWNTPAHYRFGPMGTEAVGKPIELGLDELEALRLADVEGMDLGDVGQMMEVSRATAGRIVMAARSKLASAVVEGRELHIAGGNYVQAESGTTTCGSCGGTWQIGSGIGGPLICPHCNQIQQYRADAQLNVECRCPYRGRRKCCSDDPTAERCDLEDTQACPKFGRDLPTPPKPRPRPLR